MRVTLTVTGGPHAGRRFEFDEHDSFIVGRSKKAKFRLPQKDKYFSRVHFLVEINPPLCRLLDLGSRNGTYVNQQKVSTVELKNGDTIQGGTTVLSVAIEGAAVVMHEATPDAASPDSLNRMPEPADAAPDITPGSGTETLAESRANFDAPVSPDWPSEFAVVGRAITPTPPALASGAASAPRLSERPAGLVERQPSNRGADAAPLASVEHDFARLLPPNYCELIRQREQPIAGYQIVDELGRGGMGVVFRAIRSEGQSVVAIKTVLPAVRGTATDYTKFLREANILKSLDHPHIVRFRDIGESNGIVYFVMDFVPGCDANRLLKDTAKPLPVARAVRLIVQMLKALEEAHARGFVHRDIKPSNLLVEPGPNGDDVARLTDFGLARTYQASRLSGLTMTGAIGGTTPFMAPEQITNFRDSKPAVDQYSAAASLYYLLTRRYIYDFPRVMAKQLLMILQDAPVPITQHRGDLQKTLVSAIDRGLAREPEDRFDSARSFRLALQPFC